MNNIKQALVQLLHKLLTMLTAKLSETLREKIYETAVACIGQDVSPVQNEYACAESVNTVVQRAIGVPAGGQYSTYWMYQALKSSLKWREIVEPNVLPGDIIISPTGYGNVSILPNGHVGIMGNDSSVMSNHSATSLWERNYTVETWKQRYASAGYPVKFYRILSV